MKKIFKNAMILASAIIISFSAASCSDDDNNGLDNNAINATQQTILKSYVDNVVISTYKSLADAAILLAEDCNDLSTQAKVDKACTDWKAARLYWELSEAFLFGAAKDYDIDPHIDSWPLDLTQLDQVLKAGDIETKIDAGTAGYGLLGFHAVEYIIFKEGSTGDTTNRNRTFSDITEAEAKFAAAVAEDMRNQCVRLEAAWAGIDNVTAEKKSILTENELEPTLNYSELITNAGLDGNTKYKTQAAAFEEILVGASDIANEVGNTKISDPMHSGNWSDVESPHSWNSVQDFADNIRSVQNIYFCSLNGSNGATSVSAHIASIDKTLDENVKTCITDAITKIEAMPKPFRNYINEKSGENYNKIMAAVDACNNLVKALDEAQEALKK